MHRARLAREPDWVNRQTGRSSSGSLPISEARCPTGPWALASKRRGHGAVVEGGLRWSRRTTKSAMRIDPTWPELVVRQDFACARVKAPSAAVAVEIAARRPGSMGGWKTGPETE